MDKEHKNSQMGIFIRANMHGENRTGMENTIGQTVVISKEDFEMV
jgi:hypothetical protein